MKNHIFEFLPNQNFPYPLNRPNFSSETSLLRPKEKGSVSIDCSVFPLSFPLFISLHLPGNAKMRTDSDATLATLAPTLSRLQSASPFWPV